MLENKRQVTGWREIFAIHNFIKRVTSRIYKDARQINKKESSVEKNRQWS